MLIKSTSKRLFCHHKKKMILCYFFGFETWQKWITNYPTTLPKVDKKLFIKLIAKLLEDIPEISSFLVPSGDTRYHWIEHFEISGELLEHGWSCKYEPNVSVPSNSYWWGTFSSPFFALASWKVKLKKISDNLKWKTVRLFLNLMKETYNSFQMKKKSQGRNMEDSNVFAFYSLLPKKWYW